jgi:hypothetical protein
MSKWLVVMNKQCDFCAGIKGFCSKPEVNGKSCFGMLDARPAFCPLVPVAENDLKYINARRARFENRRIFVEENRD